MKAARGSRQQLKVSLEQVPAVDAAVRLRAAVDLLLRAGSRPDPAPQDAVPASPTDAPILPSLNGLQQE